MILIRIFFKRKGQKITLVISYVFIGLFVYAAVNKLMDYHKFYSDLRNSPILSGETMAHLISWSLPSLEFIIAFLMAFQKTRLKGLYASFFLMGLFSIYIGGILLFSSTLPCSCGGIFPSFTWHQQLVFNLCFWGIALAGILLYRRNQTFHKTK